MRVPLSWLAERVPLRTPPDELARRLTIAGLETAYDPGPGAGWANVVVGLVTDVRPHPNADRLRLADVDTGDAAQTVVCGAPNLAAGQKIAFARVGAVLANGKTGEPMELTAAVIRGVESAGMVCSERELGLSDEHEGILVLSAESPVGAPLADALPSGGALEVEVTPNRGDCLSVLGVAREVAAVTGERVAEPPADYPEAGPPIADAASVEIADAALCSRYTCSLIRGVSVGPSPDWLRKSLEDAGHRSINNVVDVTNYVMLECGQPLHAFDLDEVRDGRIIVRPAAEGERFASLDGQEHTLRPPMLMIADPERAIGLAGVMGGANSEMTESTRNVLLESATFNAINTRRTVNALKLRTDASLRFEKGLNPELAERALRRATRLILETAGGEAAQGVCDEFPGKSPAPRIPFSHAGLRRLLGADFSEAQVRGALDALGFAVEGAADGAMTVTPPYWRTDVSIEEDVIEEVARIIGYDVIEGAPLEGAVPSAIPQPERALREEARDALVAFGLQETISHTLVSREDAALPDGREPLAVHNPMSQEQSCLRTSLRPALLRGAGVATRQWPVVVRRFEVGRVFIPRPNDLPDEREMAVVVLTGPRQEHAWQGPREVHGRERKVPTSFDAQQWGAEVGLLDFYDAKGVAEGLLTRFGVTAAFERASDPMLHPGRTAAILVNGERVGIVGELPKEAMEAFDIISYHTAIVEIDLQRLAPHVPAMRSSFAPFSRYPSATRDIAPDLSVRVSAQAALDVIAAHPLVVRATPFDLFEGGALPEGVKSLTFNVEFQSPDRTLTAGEVNDAVVAIRKRMEDELGATFRGTESQ